MCETRKPGIITGFLSECLCVSENVAYIVTKSCWLNGKEHGPSWQRGEGRKPGANHESPTFDGFDK